MNKFDYSRYCIEQLFNKVPDIKALQGALRIRLEECMVELDAPDKAHDIYESILCDYFLKLIKQPNAHNKKVMNKITKLIENLANHNDFEVRCVAQVSFIEPLLDKLTPHSAIEKYLLPKSLQLAREIGMERFGLDYKIGWKKITKW